MSITLEHREGRILIEISEDIRNMFRSSNFDERTFMMQCRIRYEIMFKDDPVWYYGMGFATFFRWLTVLTSIL